jgi:hypothetical protein
VSVRATNWAWDQGPRLGMNSGELLLLVRIADHADNDGVCWPGTKALAHYCVSDESTIRRRLKRLETYGLLHRERRIPEIGRGRLADSIHLHMPGIVQPGKTPAKSETTNRAKSTRPTGHFTPDQPGISTRSYIEEPTENPQRTVTPPTPRKRGERRKRGRKPIEVRA